MGLVIRDYDPATMADAFAIDGGFRVDSRLVVSVDRGEVRFEVEPVAPYVKDYDEDDPHDPEGMPDEVVFVAFLDDEVAGRIVLSEGWNGLAWIEDIAVDGSYRRAGIGRALIERAADWARGRGLAGLRAETQDVNVAACRFYERCGFRLGGFDRDLYGGIDATSGEVALFWYRPLPGG